MPSAKKAASRKTTKKKATSRKQAAPKRATPKTKPALVPDTSVLVDGRVTLRMQEGELHGARILIPKAAIAELESQANAGRESGFAGLDEVVKIQELKDAAECDVTFVGERPSLEAIELAKAGEIDALIRAAAVDAGAKLLTSDRVQAHVARAMGLDVEWVRPEVGQKEAPEDIENLGIMDFFEDDVMSAHLKQNVPPYVKRGRPGAMKLEKFEDEPMELRELTRMRRDIIEAAKRDPDSFIEIERRGATVVQLRNMRIAIAQPPFSDGVEITAVRPIAKLDIEAYELQQDLQKRLDDYQRGIFVSGPPGSGKSTFVTAIAEYLRGKNAIVKTMESPRDLQVSDEITQYAPLERDMELTSDVLLLVRPDFVIYDEVRKTSDFAIFADMRLAGVGLIGVTHANRGIDAIQRLIGRVELGMIPQVVDTVIHIVGGQIQQVLDVTFTVKVPAGMTEQDLARPVIQVRDFATKTAEYELYTYGEQVVVMPVSAAAGGAGQAPSARDRLASDQLQHVLRRYIDAPFDVEVAGEKVTVYTRERDIPMLVGRGGSNVKELERTIGMKVDIRSFADKRGRAEGAGTSPKTYGESDRRPRRNAAPLPIEQDEYEADEDEWYEEERRYAEIAPELRKSKKNIVLLVDKDLAGQRADVVIEDEPILTATVGSKGDIRIARGSETGELILDALARGEVVKLRV